MNEPHSVVFGVVLPDRRLLWFSAVFLRRVGFLSNCESNSEKIIAGCFAVCRRAKAYLEDGKRACIRSEMKLHNCMLNCTTFHNKKWEHESQMRCSFNTTVHTGTRY